MTPNPQSGASVQERRASGPAIPPEFILAIPKTDLHIHVDGSLRIPTLVELARAKHINLPSYTEEGLRQTVFKDQYRDLGEYLTGFGYTCKILQDRESLERVAYEMAVDSFEDGVRYLEPRFAPQLHVNNELEIPTVLRSIDAGLRRAADETNARAAVRDGTEPPYGYGIIVCAMRMFTARFSEYFKKFLEVHAYSPLTAVHGMASLEMVQAAVRIRDELGIPIVGFDLAGQEDGYPAHEHIQAFQFAHRHFLKKTVHAGEAYGPESIFEAITDLHADRIGHGYYLFDADRITDPEIADHERYVRSLAEFIADRRITIEICLTSNLQTNPALRTLAEHPVRRMLEAKISTTFCTDNRLVSHTSVSREIALAVEHLGLSPRQVKECVINGFKRSFIPQSYLHKREYVRRVIDYYESLERRFLGAVTRENPG